MKKQYFYFLPTLLLIIFNINVFNAQNAPPVFTSTTPVTSLNEDQVYNYIIRTSDADGDAVTVTDNTLPSWLSLNGQPTGTVTTFSGSGNYGYLDGTATEAKFKSIDDIAIGRDGIIYVIDKDNYRIRKITPAGVVSTLAGSSYGYADGTGASAQFKGPGGIAVDGNGNVFVADTDNNRIRKITPAGVVTTFAGSGNVGHADGTGTQATFTLPEGVTVDSDGNVYVADTYNNSIRKITPSGVVTTLAGGVYGYLDGTGTAARFKYIQAIAVDNTGNVYVSSGYKIRKITPSGVVTTLAGSLTESIVAGHNDGTGAAATFDDVRGLTVDVLGNVYAADRKNHCVRKITPAGAVTTLAGSGVGGYANGFGTSAKFLYPYGVAADDNDNVYVADMENLYVRKIAGAYTLTGNGSGNVGVYNIALNANDGNGGTALQNFTLTVNAILGLEDVILKGFAMYPNPVNDVLNISAKEDIKEIQIFSLLGQLVMQKVNNSNEVHLNLNKLSQGAYFVKIYTKDKAKVVKLIKQ